MGLSTWRGCRNDMRTIAMLEEVNRLTPTIPFYPVQGGFNKGGVAASAGTHDGAAVDIRTRNLSLAQKKELVRLMRMVGFAAWWRQPNWDHRGGGEHIHAIPVGGNISRGAKSQVNQYFNGTNGLASRGKDDGPRQYVGVTWEKYLANRDKKPSPAPAPAPAPAPKPASPAAPKAKQWFGPRPRPVLAVDGLAGKVTIKCFQEYLSTYIPNDGVWGPVTCKKAQQWLKVKQDGVWGPVTQKAFCAKLGVKPIPSWVIGRPKDQTTFALQRYLNARRG